MVEREELNKAQKAKTNLVTHLDQKIAEREKLLANVLNEPVSTAGRLAQVTAEIDATRDCLRAAKSQVDEKTRRVLNAERRKLRTHV